MAELDCETLDSTVRSLSSMTGVSGDDIRARMSAWTWRAFERFEQRRWIGDDFDVTRAELWRRVFRDLPRPVPDAVYWFHATRVLPNTDFAEGLLPLPSAKVRLIESLGKIGLHPSSATGTFHRDAHEEKMQHRTSWGPCGFLVREAAFSPIQNHFFRAPELVVDLGYDLDKFRAATVPCIVRFRATDPRDDVAELALCYAYLASWRKPADWDCSTTWDGKGRAVPPEDIIRIEFLDRNLFRDQDER